MPARWALLPLAVLLPLVVRAAYVFVWLATRDARLSRFAAPGVALATWLLGIHAVGRVTHSFYAGLVSGTLVLAVAGLASLRVRVPPRSADEPSSRWIWVGMALVAPLVLAPEFWWSKHDECLLTGHISIPAEIQNGIYPPRHLTFPAFELRYHYGVDLAAAALSSVLGRIDIAATVHGLAVVLWAYSFCLYWLVGERLVGARGAGPITALCVLFAGGAPYFCRSPSETVDYLTSMCKAGGTWITPPLVSNFLQHPWSLGIPLFAIVLLLVVRFAGTPPSPWGWALLSVIVLVLSFTQVVLFLCIVPALVAAAALEGRSLACTGPWMDRALARLRNAGPVALWAVAMVLAARWAHGFFAPVAEPSQGKIELHPFWLDATAREWLAWHAQAFGALLPLGIAGFFVVRVQRGLLGLLACGSLLVRDTFSYTPGWNIVKFSMVTQLVLALLAAGALTWALARPRLRLAAGAGVLLATFFGLAWPLALTFQRPARECLPPPPVGADRQAIDFLRGRVVEGEGVYRSEGAGVYALHGLPQQTSDWAVERFGFSQRLFDDRRRMTAHPEDTAAFTDQGFRWLVLGPADGPLLLAARAWTLDGRAEVAAEFPPLAVFRLH
jgi:hypothetical protein